MDSLFLLSAVLAVVGAVAAMTLRGSIHCVLSLTVSLVGVAGLYLDLGVQFVGLTQILIYIGAVAILAGFALMMAPDAMPRSIPHLWPSSLAGGLIGTVIFAALIDVLLRSHFPALNRQGPPSTSVNQFGLALLNDFSVPLEVIGVLLTGALIGAVVVAMPSSKEDA